MAEYSLLWCSFILCAVLTECVPQLRNIARHGKRSINEAPQYIISRFHGQVEVPKSFFKHMYILGVIIAAIILYKELFNRRDLRGNVVLCLSLYTLHVTRRLVESTYFTIYGNSRMHIGGYIAGMCHYCAAPLTVTLDTSTGECLPPFASGIITKFSLLLYLVSTYYQSKAHYILYSLKLGATMNTDSGSFPISPYALPTDSLFKYTSCPHYTAEILLYVSFSGILHCNSTMWLMTLWVVSNLIVVSNRQYMWYCDKYRDEVPEKWSRLFPGVW